MGFRMRLNINRDQYLELEKLALGVFSPLSGFMGEGDFHSCVYDFKLKSGEFFPLPIVFDVSRAEAEEMKKYSEVELFYQSEFVGKIYPDSYFMPDRATVAKEIFQTAEDKHPGVRYFYDLKEVFVGGRVELIKRCRFEFQDYEMTPCETKAYFKDLGWKKIVGFQTRNAPHRAHEYLQRIALEVADGLLIQPLVGKKKEGDFTPEAVLKGYRALIENYFPPDRVKLSILSTVMRYAGPREALFHAIIRKNYGCTHFIVGRDHAGVGSYYKEYAAHSLVDRFQDKLGIEILKLNGPYLCLMCDSITTSNSCRHKEFSPEHVFEISGTYVRKQLMGNGDVDRRIIRPEVLDALKGINPFI